MSRQPTALADCDKRAEDLRFARALEFDHRRESEEAAKKRAVAQRCDYQSFHQLVAGARLSPMKKKWTEELARGGKIADISRDSPHVDRRPGFHGGATIAVNRAATPLTASSTPTTLDEFHRSWRRLCGDDDGRKTTFLLQLPIDSLQRIFKVRLSPLYFSIRVTNARVSECIRQVELGLQLLREFVRLVCSHCERDETTDEDISNAARFLLALTSCGRFHAHLNLAGPSTRDAGLDVLRRASRLDDERASPWRETMGIR